MIFEWDERKRAGNLRKHGIDFADCAGVFSGRTATFLDERFAYDEVRFMTLGLLGGQVVVIAHTETPDTVRVISVRKATKREEAFYFKSIQD